MRWSHKAKVQRLFANLPRGDVLYRGMQKRFGSITTDPMSRVCRHAAMLRALAELSFSMKGSRCLEVGTGHVPVAPVACFLAGATEVVTVDLHRRIDLSVTSQMLGRLVASQSRLEQEYQGLVDPGDLDARLRTIEKFAARPLELFEHVGVRYQAPEDASRLSDPDGSFDLHFSITTLEHIESSSLLEILREAKRLLRPGGMAAHLVDPSDHFAHQDSSISEINFLRYDESTWRRIAGNEFSYCNRLRAPDYLQLFGDVGLALERADTVVSDRSLSALSRGFAVHGDFAHYDSADLCTTAIDIYSRG